MRESWGRSLLLMLFLGASGACQTAATRELPVLPRSMDSLFKPCGPTDGAALLRIFEQQSLLASTEMEWVARPTGQWQLNFSSPIGQSLLTIRHAGATFKVTGRLTRKVPKLAVGEEGYVEADGHRLGIKAVEIPCLLASRLPRAWLVNLVAVRTTAKATTLEFAEPGRQIGVVRPASGPLCATMTWRRFLWWTQDLSWCQAEGGQVGGRISGLGEHSLQWVRIDDQAS